MKNLKKPIVVAGNWKLNPTTINEAKKLFSGIKRGLANRRLRPDIIIAPPTLFITELAKAKLGKKIKLAAQTVFAADSGAHTGEVSVPMLKSIGVNTAIIGHSERRARDESDEDVNAAILALIKAGGMTIVCVGEKKRDRDGNYLALIENQVRLALTDVPATKLEQVIIAYEPIWAIGTGDTATPEDAYEMKIFIKKVLSDDYNRPAAAKVRVLYGGSVKADNAEALLSEGQVDGFLIGGASLKVKEFLSIINTAHEFRA